MTSVELPSGVEHHLTRTRAVSWEAYDALTVEDGWTEHDASIVNKPDLRWKEGEIRGFSIVVFEPRFARTAS